MAPLEYLFDASPKAVEKLAELPPILRNDPDIRAVIYADAKEAERQVTTLDALRLEFFPQWATEVGLPWWEGLFRLPIAPAGVIVVKRRETVVGASRRLNRDMTGVDWQEAVTLILGTSSWSYVEHDPADPTTPPAYVIRIVLPLDPAAYDYPRAEALIRAQSPAGWDFVLTYDAGFVLGESQLGEEAL